MKKLLRLWPLLFPLAVTATLYAQCHGVVQLQYNGQNIGTASTINFVCPGGGGGGGGTTLNVTVNGGSTYNIPTNLRFDAGSNMTIAQGFDGTTMDVTFSSTGGGGSFSGDVSTTTQGYLNDSATNTGVLIRDTNGVVIANDGNTTNATLTCTSSGVLALKAGQAFTADTIFPTSANSSLILEPSGSGAGVLVQSGKALLTDNVTTTSSGALTIGSGGGNTNITETPSGTGQVAIGNGRMSFSDAAVNPATTGFLFRNATHLVWFNGSSAINLDAPSGTTFSGDINTTTFGFLTDSATSTPINLFDTDGVSFADDSNTKSARLKCLANNVLTLNSGQTFATDNITSSSPGPVTIGSGGGNTNVNLVPSGTGVVQVAAGNTITADQVNGTTINGVTKFLANGTGYAVENGLSGSYTNLLILCADSTNTTHSSAVVTATNLTLWNTSGQAVVAKNVSLTVAINASGALGLDTGSAAIDSDYALWVMQNAAGTLTAVWSLSHTAAGVTAPSGHSVSTDFMHRVCDGFTAHTSALLLVFTQQGKTLLFNNASGFATTIDGNSIIVNGTSATFSGQSASARVPPSSRVAIVNEVLSSTGSSITTLIGRIRATGSQSATGEFVLEIIGVASTSLQIRSFGEISLNSSQSFEYLVSATTNFTLVILGYQDNN